MKKSRMGLHEKLRRLVRLLLRPAAFVSNVLPSTIGGDVLRVSRLSRGVDDADSADTFASVVLERLSGWLVLPLMFGLLVDPDLREQGRASVGVAAAVAAGTLGRASCWCRFIADHPRLGGRFAESDGWTRFVRVQRGVAQCAPTLAALGVVLAGLAYQLVLVRAAMAAAPSACGRPVSPPAGLPPRPSPSPRCCPSASPASACARAPSCCSSARSGSREEAIALGLLLYLLNLVVSLPALPPSPSGVRGESPTREHAVRYSPSEAVATSHPATSAPGHHALVARDRLGAGVYGIYSLVRNQFGRPRSARRTPRARHADRRSRERARPVPRAHRAALVSRWAMGPAGLQHLLRLVPLRGARAILVYLRPPAPPLPHLAQHHPLRHPPGPHRLLLVPAHAAPPARQLRRVRRLRQLRLRRHAGQYGGLWSFDSGTMEQISNQYAAMPSLHFAWSMWVFLVLVPHVKHRWSGSHRRLPVADALRHRGDRQPLLARRGGRCAVIAGLAHRLRLAAPREAPARTGDVNPESPVPSSASEPADPSRADRPLGSDARNRCLMLLDSIHSPPTCGRSAARARGARRGDPGVHRPAVTADSGHLGSNLGAVELTLALHRVFDSPHDIILWDTGHQAYVHKILTGRQSQFSDAAQGRRPVGLPVPGGVRARLDREQPRLDGPLLRPRPGRGPGERAGEGRRVVAVIGDGS